MALPYPNLSSFIYKIHEAYTEYALNQRFAKLLANDKYIANHFSLAPGIWECSWYNNPSVIGYGMGDICWLNTTDVRSFITANSDIIKIYADGNPKVINKLKKYDIGDEAIFESYYNVLTGYTDDTGTKLSAVFEIGQLSKCIQLIVSTKDNNKDPIQNDESWKKFFVDDEAEVDKVLNDVIKFRSDIIFKDHLKYYHLDDVNTSQIKLKNYINANCDNISAGYQHYLPKLDEMHGFDFIKVYAKHPYENDKLSSITENQWFRLWNSGYLEHGGIINIKNAASIDDIYVNVNLKWQITDDKIMAYTDGELAKSTSSVISVDESHEYNGDNLVNLIIEAKDLSVNNSPYAPVYDNSNYIINLTPIVPYKDNEDTNLYPPPINIFEIENCVENQINVLNTTSASFSFAYNYKSTAPYYSYYTAGYTKPFKENS